MMVLKILNLNVHKRDFLKLKRLYFSSKMHMFDELCGQNVIYLLGPEYLLGYIKDKIETYRKGNLFEHTSH